MKSTLCLFFGLLLSNAFCLKAQDSTTVRLTQLMQDYPVMGLSIAVVKDGKVVHTQALGWKEEGKELLESSDLFRIASISKSFTAIGLMQLVEKGTLSLDDDVSELIGFRIRNPKFPDTVITLRMLLSHTSSINDQQGYFTLDAIHPEKNATWQAAYNAYAPGKGYQYCNLNFNLAGAILEKYSGFRFDAYIQENILKPLGLYGGYDVDQLDKSRLATLYTYQRDSAKFTASPAAYVSKSEELKTYVPGYSTPIFSPTGGMKISAPDLAKYLLLHMNYGKVGKVRLISAAHSQEMQTPLSSDENYGLALWKTNVLIPGVELVGHTGSAYGLYSGMFFNPEEKYGFVVISNGCDPTYEAGFNIVIRKAFQILYEEWILNR
ncbi:MAG: serine hydrolase [Bacteroidetes bacterium]|nr:serine hydrolase [Bacteroidota bacterium]